MFIFVNTTNQSVLPRPDKTGHNHRSCVILLLPLGRNDFNKKLIIL